jgi:hypothetical protein
MVSGRTEIPGKPVSAVSTQSVRFPPSKPYRNKFGAFEILLVF